MTIEQSKLRDELTATLEPGVLITAVGLVILRLRSVELPPDDQPGVQLTQADYDAFWASATITQLRLVKKMARKVSCKEEFYFQ
jgi:hypothetical protein